MRELVKVASNAANRDNERMRAVLIHIAAAGGSFLASRAAITGELLPFGIAAVAGVPISLLPASAIGTFFGYLIPAVGNGAFRYIAAMLAVLSVRLLLGSDKKLTANSLFGCLLALGACGLSAAVTFNGLPFDAAGLLAESVLAAGGSVFVSRAVKAVMREEKGLSGEELAAALICISFLLIGADSISLFYITLGRVLSIVIILLCGKFGGILSGAVAGAAISFASVLGGTDVSLAALYSLAGVIGGIFAIYGKYAQIGVLSAVFLIGALLSWSGAAASMRMIEVIAGSIVFLIIPRGWGIYLARAFSAYPKIITPTGAKKALTMRLQLAANALSDVSGAVEQVSNELSKINSPDYGEVIARVERDACTGCNFRVHCWEARRDKTLNALLAMTKAVKLGSSAPENEAPAEFRDHCLRPRRIGEAVRLNYGEYAAKTAAENRIEEVRSVVSDQFSGIALMLSDMSEELEKEDKFDSSSAVLAADALKSIGISLDECSSSLDRFGRMTVRAKLKKSRDLVLNKRKIMKILSIACERDFDIPIINELGGDVFITLNEHAEFTVQLGVHQLSASGARMCGDAYRYFNDGTGRFTMILSDGMGTGGRAAVDSAMASGLMARLLRAGFGYDSALKILNSAMLFKSSDESLATVDIASIDLHSGEAKLFKAGAAPTLLRRSGRTGKAESRSLPAGILRDVHFDRADIKLKSGDIVLMVSDGAVSEGTDWIRDELNAWEDGSADDLAEHICNCARRRRSDNHEDDITVMAAFLKRAV